MFNERIIMNVFSDGVNDVAGREWLIGALTKGTLTVKFVKLDGTVRSMTCTLDPALLPKSVNTEKPKVERKKSPDVLAVYDTIEQGWRSFRWDSVESVIFDSNN